MQCRNKIIKRRKPFRPSLINSLSSDMTPTAAIGICTLYDTCGSIGRSPHPLTSRACPTAGQARDDDVKDVGNTPDNGHENSGDTIDNCSERATDRAEDRLNARDDSTHSCGLFGRFFWKCLLVSLFNVSR